MVGATSEQLAAVMSTAKIKGKKCIKPPKWLVRVFGFSQGELEVLLILLIIKAAYIQTERVESFEVLPSPV